MEAVHGPGLIGVAPLAQCIGIPVWKAAKTLLFQAEVGCAGGVGLPGSVIVLADHLEEKQARAQTSHQPPRRTTGAGGTP